jgi:hypothetical protein
MTGTTAGGAGAVRRAVRCTDVRAGGADVARGIEDLYDDRVDVIIVRDAMPRAPLAAAAATLDAAESRLAWSRPNKVAPPDDIHILGTDTPATPTYSAPAGYSLEAYLAGAAKHRAQTADVFPAGFDAIAEIERALGRTAGGRPVELARAADGRAFTPYTLRRLGDGKQIGFHHDYHYPLSMYKDLAPIVDTTTLVSWVFTLQRPSAGGELMVYALAPDDADIPKGPNGWPDVPGVERLFDHRSYAMNAGDMFLLASGRCYHRITPISGASRVTMGGFLAFDKSRERVFYWS